MNKLVEDVSDPVLVNRCSYSNSKIVGQCESTSGRVPYVDVRR